MNKTSRTPEPDESLLILEPWTSVQAMKAIKATYAADIDPEVVGDMRDALKKIANEPLGKPEASHREVLAACVEIARAALAKARLP